MTEKITYIPSRIKNASVGGHVTGTEDIIDDVLGKEQNQINAETNERLSTLEESVGTGGSVDERIAAEGARHYLKEETYNKTELNSMITTPNQEYVTVATYASLPVTGSADTVYRVSNYDGSTSQVDATMYSEYAWDGTQYVFLCVKSQTGEVFNITAYNSNTKYADLAAALGTNGANVPANLRKGGMSVKFVCSSDNNYVQYRLTSQSFNTNLFYWKEADSSNISNDISRYVYNETVLTGTVLLDSNIKIGEVLYYHIIAETGKAGYIGFYDSNNTLLLLVGKDAGGLQQNEYEGTIQIPENCVSIKTGGSGNLDIVGLYGNLFNKWLRSDIDSSKGSIEQLYKNTGNIIKLGIITSGTVLFDSSKVNVGETVYYHIIAEAGKAGMISVYDANDVILATFGKDAGGLQQNEYNGSFILPINYSYVKTRGSGNLEIKELSTRIENSVIREDVDRNIDSIRTIEGNIISVKCFTQSGSEAKIAENIPFKKGLYSCSVDLSKTLSQNEILTIKEGSKIIKTFEIATGETSQNISFYLNYDTNLCDIYVSGNIIENGLSLNINYLSKQYEEKEIFFTTLEQAQAYSYTVLIEKGDVLIVYSKCEETQSYNLNIRSVSIITNYNLDSYVYTAAESGFGIFRIYNNGDKTSFSVRRLVLKSSLNSRELDVYKTQIKKMPIDMIDNNIDPVIVFDNDIEGQPISRIPSVLIANDNSVLCAAEIRQRANETGKFDILLKRYVSGELVNTVSIYTFDETYGRGQGVPMVIDRTGGAGHTGRVYIFYNTILDYEHSPASQPAENFKLWYRYSDDNGVTWGSPVEITQLRPEGVNCIIPSPVNGLQASDGTLYVMLYYVKYDFINNRNAGCGIQLISKNYASENWNVVADYYVDIYSDDYSIAPNEVTIVESNDKKIILNCRTLSNKARGVFIYDPLQKSFKKDVSDCSFVPMCACSGSIIKVQRNSMTYYLFSLPDPETVDGRERITLWGSMDCVHWMRLYIINVPWSEGYSCLSYYNNQLIAIYEKYSPTESYGANHTYCVKKDLTSLLSQIESKLSFDWWLEPEDIAYNRISN